MEDVACRKPPRFCRSSAWPAGLYQTTICRCDGMGVRCDGMGVLMVWAVATLGCCGWRSRGWRSSERRHRPATWHPRSLGRSAETCMSQSSMRRLGRSAVGADAAVGRAGPPLQQASAFQLVDQRHHATGGDLHAFPRACRGGGPQQHDGAGSPPRPPAGLPSPSRMEALWSGERGRGNPTRPREPRGRAAEWDHRGTRGKPGTEGSGFGMFYTGNSYNP
jgi:hypothetical protein